MSDLPTFATLDEVEEELTFTNVLIDSLDPGADDFDAQLAPLDAARQDLEQRHARLRQAPSPPTHQISGMDGASDFWQATMNGRPESSDGQGDRSFETDSSSVNVASGKRTLPAGFALNNRSKRPTPGPSSAGTPDSSTDSFEMVEHPGRPGPSGAEASTQVRERARERHLRAEAAMKRLHADEEYARSLGPSPQSTAGPSYPFGAPGRANVQTTFGVSGWACPSTGKPSVFARPTQATPPPSAGPSTRPLGRFGAQARAVKQEYSPSQQLPQRPRSSVGVVDLTGDDSDSDGPAEITSAGFTPSQRPSRPVARNNYLTGMHSALAPPTYGMPGAWPINTAGQSVYGVAPVVRPPPMTAYGDFNTQDDLVRQQYKAIRDAQVATRNALAGVEYQSSGVSGQIRELDNLINGNSARNPQDVDDDLVYGGARQRPLGDDPIDPYQNMNELYRQRYDTIANHDPAASKEEITKLLENIRPDEDMPAHLRVQTPEAMTIQLHKYQELGLTWLQKCEEGSNKGGILADDMGLGKTIQMLSLIVTRPSDDIRCKTTLIVAPVALMRQWKQEIQQKIKPGRHALTVFIHHGQGKKKDFHSLRNFDVVLTTFGSLASEVKKMESFRLRQHNDPDAAPYDRERCALLGADAKWYRVILDEAQCIKNRSTQTAKGAYMLNAKYRFCVTGTPMMNNVDELFSLVHFLKIKPYCVWEKFRINFSTPMKQARDDVREKSMRALQALCRAVMLRRTKKSTYEGQPILILPERTTQISNPVFSQSEKEVYDSLEGRTQLQFNKYLRAGTVGKSYSAILVLLLRLRQACCHPHLIRDFGVSAAADATPEEILNLAKTLDEKVVARIKEREGNFECPVCYDAATNPAIFIPCGHDTCSDCFAKITDPAMALAAGQENAGGNAKCPECRGVVDPKKVTDFASFKRVWQPELLTAEERREMGEDAEEEEEEDGEGDGSETESASDDEDEDEDEVDQRGNLRGFIVKDAEDGSETESEVDGEGGNNSFRKLKAKPLKKDKKRSKGKGKAKEKDHRPSNKIISLQTLKKLSQKNAQTKKAYLRRLRKDWVESAKIVRTLAILADIMADPHGEKVLIFSQWTSLLDLLEIPIDGLNYAYRRYDGSMNATQRGDAVDDFRDPAKNIRIMLVSLKAGNAGLNLNMASQVIILDPFWNPYIEDQAIDRAHRIGQTREVKVHRLLVRGTVEDRICELQEKKRGVIGEALDEKAGQSIARLGVRELAFLFGVTGGVGG